jgi:hypothetical protein
MRSRAWKKFRKNAPAFMVVIGTVSLFGSSFTYFHSNNTRPLVSGPTIKADHGGVAAGRDINYGLDEVKTEKIIEKVIEKLEVYQTAQRSPRSSTASDENTPPRTLALVSGPDRVELPFDKRANSGITPLFVANDQTLSLNSTGLDGTIVSASYQPPSLTSDGLINPNVLAGGHLSFNDTGLANPIVAAGYQSLSPNGNGLINHNFLAGSQLSLNDAGLANPIVAASYQLLSPNGNGLINQNFLAGSQLSLNDTGLANPIVAAGYQPLSPNGNGLINHNFLAGSQLPLNDTGLANPIVAASYQLLSPNGNGLINQNVLASNLSLPISGTGLINTPVAPNNQTLSFGGTGLDAPFIGTTMPIPKLIGSQNL